MKKNQERPPFWTSAGLKRLGHVIKSSLEFRGISQNEAAQAITRTTGFYITKGGLNKVLNSTTKMPEFNTLVAIAASGLVVDEKGRSLTIYDFIDIASESCTGVGMNLLLIELINKELIRRNWSLRDLAEDTGILYEDLKAVMDGQEPQEYVLDMVADVLINPATGLQFSSSVELADYLGQQITPTHYEQGHRKHINGLC